MTMLANIAITTAVTAQVTSPLQLGDGVPESASLQATLAYGSDGSTISAWAQTSLDEGLTWCDVANFSFTTSAARFIFNVSALTPKTTEVTPTDGSLTANTAIDGVLGPLWRVKYTSTGTYAGGTALRIDMNARGRLTI